MRSVKKFAMLLTILVGTSLAVYAAVIVPQMRNLSVSNITSTTARFRLECMNTDYLNIYVKLDVNSDYQLIDSLTVSINSPNNWIVSEFSIRNMQPDSQYYIQVDAVGYADSETGERSLRGQSISFRTAIE